MSKIFFLSISFFLLVGCSVNSDAEEPSKPTTLENDSSISEKASSVASLPQDAFFTVTFFTGDSDNLQAFSEPIEAKISDGVEIADTDIPYEIDVKESEISIRWSESGQFDQYEGVIANGENQRLVFEFTEPFLDGRDPVVNASSNLFPKEILVPSPAQLIVEFDAGTEVGDGFESSISLD